MRIVKEICRSVKFRLVAKGERGFAMVEVLVALVLIGVTGASFLTALTTVSKSTITTDLHSTADSLATSQMEYILSQDYDDTSTPLQYAPIPNIPVGWSVNVAADRLDPESDGPIDDDGIQEISVTVKYGGKEIVALTSRKVNITYVP